MKRGMLLLALLLLAWSVSGCQADPTPSAVPTVSPTTAPIETGAPSETPEPEVIAEPEPVTIVYKPCLAFDAIGAIEVRGGNYRDIDGAVKAKLADVPITGSSSFFYAFFLEHYSFEEVESMDLSAVAKAFPECLKVNEFFDAEWVSSLKEYFTQGFALLEEMDYTSLWEERCLPLLTKQCESAYAAYNDSDVVQAAISDIQRLRPGVQLDDVTVYVSYHKIGTSFQLSDSRFLTNSWSANMDSLSSLPTFIHELTHSVADEALEELYRQTAQADVLLGHARHVQFDHWGSPCDEEEFVVALEHFLAVKHEIWEEDEGCERVAKHYGGCMPLAVIVFDELMKRGDIPDDINAWITNLFETGVIQAGDISRQADDVSPGFTERFNEKWGDCCGEWRQE